MPCVGVSVNLGHIYSVCICEPRKYILYVCDIELYIMCVYACVYACVYVCVCVYVYQCTCTNVYVLFIIYIYIYIEKYLLIRLSW